MKARLRIMGLIIALVLCTSAIATNAFAIGAGNGWLSGEVEYNGYPYEYTLTIRTDRNIGGYQSTCDTDACIKRVHYSLEGRWLTKNYGYQTATAGYHAVAPMSETSSSDWVICPKGAEQVVQFTRGTGSISMYGDTIVTKSVSIWA